MSNLLSKKYKRKTPPSMLQTFSKYLLYLMLIISTIAISILIYLLCNWHRLIQTTVSLFEYFEMSDKILEYIHYVISHNNVVYTTSTFISVIILYAIVLEKIKSKKIQILHTNEQDSKYFLPLMFYYGYFNFILLIPFILYLFLKKGSILETFIVITLYIISKKIFLNSLISWNRVINSYKERKRIEKVIRLLSKKIAKNKIMKFVKSNSNSINIFNKKILNESVNFLRIISDPGIAPIITIIIYKNFLVTLQQAISFFAPIIVFILLKAGFNLLTIIYTVLTLLFWYFVISTISFLPFNEVDIVLVNGKKVKNVFIIDSRPKGWITIIDKNEKKQKINENNIITILPSHSKK